MELLRTAAAACHFTFVDKLQQQQYHHKKHAHDPNQHIIKMFCCSSISYNYNPHISPSYPRLATWLLKPSYARTSILCSSLPQQPLSSSQSTASASSGDGSLRTSPAVQEAIKRMQPADSKPEICTADELHYISVPGTRWKLALWRYPPRPQAPTRNHPLLLLSGLGTNAIGFDLDPSVSFARYMAEQGFDTWILELRGSGLSKVDDQLVSNEISKYEKGTVSQFKEILSKRSLQYRENVTKTDGPSSNDVKSTTSLSNILAQIVKKGRGFLEGGQSRLMTAPLLEKISKLLEESELSERYIELQEKLLHLLNEQRNSAVTKRIINLGNRLIKLLEDGQRAVSPQLSGLQDRIINGQQIADLQERLITTIDDLQKLLDLVVTYDWDFDNYLEEDLPAAMDYIRKHSNPKDGRMHAVGHSMGGILLYSLIATQKQSCGLASAVTLASSLDYSVSNSSLKMLLPLADPAQILNVPAVPLGALMASIYPLAINPPYMMAWLTPQVSAQDMMDPELFMKLILNNFCTIPAKLLVQLTTVFRPRGLCNRDQKFFHKEHLHECTTPVLAVAGDEDLICPPVAVLDTAKAFPEDLVEYRVFGGQNNVHYGHYDLVCGRLARQEVHTCIVDFLVRNDNL